MYYIFDCFSSRGHRITGGALSSVFALLIVLTSLTMGSALQTSAAAEGAAVAFGLPKAAVSACLALISAAVLLGGGGAVLKVTDRVVPFMTVGFVLLSLAALFVRLDSIPTALYRIFSEAFSVRAAAGGVLGALTSEAVRLGVMRGLLSNEAGCGTSPTAHAYSVSAAPSEQGAMGVIEVFVDTVLLCTLTALVILVSGEPSEGGDLMTVTMRAFSRILGPWAGGAVSLSVIFFGGATAVCWTHYGRSGVTYLSDKKWLRVVFGVTYTLCAFLGGVIPSGGSFAAVDISLGIMTVINIITLLLCRREIVEGTEVFRRVKKRSG